MSRTQTIDRSQQERIIAEAIRDRRLLTVTYSLPDGWRRYKASFVSGSPGSNETVISLGLPRGGEIVTLPPLGAIVGGTFRLGHKKCMFSAGVRACREQSKSMLLTLGWPEHLSQLQRRAYERATPPRGNVIAVRFWCRDDESPSSSEHRDVRHGQLEDISAGGMRLKVADVEKLKLERAYKCVFTSSPGRPALVLDAILRHREAVEQGRASLGFQFVGLEMSDEGLRTLDRLARLVAHFQRSRSPHGE